MGHSSFFLEALEQRPAIQFVDDADVRHISSVVDDRSVGQEAPGLLGLLENGHWVVALNAKPQGGTRKRALSAAPRDPWRHGSNVNITLATLSNFKPALTLMARRLAEP